MILSKNIEKFIKKFLCLLNGLIFSVSSVLVQKIQVPSLLIFTRIPKAMFISYPTFINFDRNSQGYVYFIPYVYLIL